MIGRLNVIYQLLLNQIKETYSKLVYYMICVVFLF